MRKAVLVSLFLAVPSLAFGQTSNDLQPITLSPGEYQAIISALAQRDPVIALLTQKQTTAQQAKKEQQQAKDQEPSQALSPHSLPAPQVRGKLNNNAPQ